MYLGVWLVQSHLLQRYPYHHIQWVRYYSVYSLALERTTMTTSRRRLFQGLCSATNPSRPIIIKWIGLRAVPKIIFSRWAANYVSWLASWSWQWIVEKLRKGSSWFLLRGSPMQKSYHVLQWDGCTTENGSSSPMIKIWMPQFTAVLHIGPY